MSSRRRWTAEETARVSGPLPPGGIRELAERLGRTERSVLQKRHALGERTSWPAECSVEGCRQKPHARGFCPGHYSQWRRTGEPIAKPKPPKPPRPRAARPKRTRLQQRRNAFNAPSAELSGLPVKRPAQRLERPPGPPMRPEDSRRRDVRRRLEDWALARELGLSLAELG